MDRGAAVTNAASPADPLALTRQAKALLRDLLEDSLQRSLPERDLRKSYHGVALAGLKEKHCGSGGVSTVDFDLAVGGPECEAAPQFDPAT